jgi:CrcB protein
VARGPDRHPELPLDPDAPDEATPARPLHFRADALALVVAGGFVGTLGRYGLADLAPTRAGAWPWGTFVANIGGAFVLGVLLELLALNGPDAAWRQRARLLLGTGFCGALTTYSTLAVETDLLIRSRDVGLASGYLAASVAGGLLATAVGVGIVSTRDSSRQAGVPS